MRGELQDVMDETWVVMSWRWRMVPYIWLSDERDWWAVWIIYVDVHLYRFTHIFTNFRNSLYISWRSAWWAYQSNIHILCINMYIRHTFMYKVICIMVDLCVYFNLFVATFQQSFLLSLRWVIYLVASILPRSTTYLILWICGLSYTFRCEYDGSVTDATLTPNQDYYWTGGPGRSSGITTFSW